MIFNIISKGNEEIAIAECRGIIESEGFQWKLVERNRGIIVIDAPDIAGRLIAERAAFTKFSASLLYRCRIDEIESSINIRSEVPFAVRIINKSSLNKVVGARIKGVVNLTNPQRIFLGYVVDDILYLGILLAKRRGLVDRTKLIHRSNMMDPYLARAMVNLARSSKDRVFLDPFCGVGGILVEGALISKYAIGVDLDKNSVLCALKNCKNIGASNYSLIVGDSLNLNFSGIDAIATDPPYGRGAKTFGRSVYEIVSNILIRFQQWLKKGGYACISIPFTVDLQVPNSLTLVGEYLQRVHSKLTRRIFVLRKL